MKKCNIDGCENKHYAKGYCRSHYRHYSEETRKRWQKIKSNPETYIKHLEYMRVKHKEYSVDYRKHSDNVYFNGNREVAIKRDGEMCSFCKISRSEHFKMYGKDLNVHHIDGRGFGLKKRERNSELNNLLTICQSCHTKIHHGYTIYTST